MEIFKSKSFIASAVTVVLGLIILFSTVGINNNGYRQVVQWPNGTTFTKFTPGVYFSLFGSATQYADVVTTDVKCNASRTDVRYQDGGTGCVEGVVRVSLPGDEKAMLKLHKAVRSEAGLRTKLLNPEIKQALSLTAGLMTSEDAYAVRRNDYATWANDQLTDGPYVTELTEKTVKTTEGKTQTRKVPTIKLGEDGQPLHQNSALKSYDIAVAGFQITDWDFEQKTIDQISDKREAEMAIITAKANADKAVWQQKEIKANGLKEVERVKYAQLQLKEKATIEADRKKEVAIINAQRVKDVNTEKELAAIIDVRTAKQEGLATKTRADAEAYAKKAVLLADGALDKKLATYEKVQFSWAKAYASRKVPTMMMSGGAGGGENIDSNTSQFQSMLNAMIAKDLVLDPRVIK